MKNILYTHNRSEIRDNKIRDSISYDTIDLRIDWSNCDEIYKKNS